MFLAIPPLRGVTPVEIGIYRGGREVTQSMEESGTDSMSRVTVEGRGGTMQIMPNLPPF